MKRHENRQEVPIYWVSLQEVLWLFIWLVGSSYPELLFKKYVTKKFLKLKKKPEMNSLFIKVSGLQPAILLTQDHNCRCFPVDFAKFFRASILQNICKWLPLVIVGTKYVFSYFWGYMTDKYGRRPIILISAILTNFATIAFGFTTNIYWALTTRFLQGLFNGKSSLLPMWHQQ